MAGYFEPLPELIHIPQTQTVEVEETEAETLKPEKPSWLVEQTINPGDVIKFVSWIAPKNI